MTITQMQCTEITDQGGYFVLHFQLTCVDLLSSGTGSYSISVNGNIENSYFDEEKQCGIVVKLTTTSFTDGNKVIELGKFYDLDLNEVI